MFIHFWEKLFLIKNIFDIGKTGVMKVLENYQKNVFSSVLFKKFKLSNPPTYSYTENWVHHYILCFFREFSKLMGENLWWNHFTVKYQKRLRFATLPGNLTRAPYVPKSSSSRNFEKSSFNKSYRLTVNILQRY